MARHPMTIRIHRKAARRKKERRILRDERERIEEVYNPHGHVLKPEPIVSKTQQKKIEREERFVQERAERKLDKLDRRWGVGWGPIKARLKWMTEVIREKPRCPKDATHGVVEIRRRGQDNPCLRDWLCLNCREVIGPAPWRDPDQWESFIINSTEADHRRLKKENACLVSALEKARAEITRLREFASLAKDCPKGVEHLLPIAADALLSGSGPGSAGEEEGDA